MKNKWRKNPICIDCNKVLKNHYALRCKGCFVTFCRGVNSALWIERPRCIDCKEQLKTLKSKRCYNCSNKLNRRKRKNTTKGRKMPQIGIKNSGSNNGNWNNGVSLKKYYCVDCMELLANYKAKRCKSCAQKDKNNSNYIDGRSFEEYPIEFNNKLKEQIRKRDNYQCQNCGIIEEEYIIVFGEVLGVHHIDYDKENCDENNLITLCRSCNARANFNREYLILLFTNKQKVLIGDKNGQGSS